MVSRKFTIFVICTFLFPADAFGQTTGAPFALEPDTELIELFGYAPDYTQNVPSFDVNNSVYIRSRGVDIHETSFFHVLEDGAWHERDFLDAVRDAYPDFERFHQGAGRFAERLVFDSENRAYSILNIRLTGGSHRNILLFSEDEGRSWEVHHLSNGGIFAMEHFVGHNEIHGPPFLLLSRRKADEHPDPWADYHEFYFVQPRIEDGRLVVPSYTENHINNNLISLGQHSGGSSCSVTRNGKTHFVWIEVTEDEVFGTPTYVATYNHATGHVGPHHLLFYAPPRNNSHNRPGIVIDSEGYLHVVTGAHHGESFYYTRSLLPDDAYSGWTEPEPVWNTGWTAVSGEERGGQTYVALVCDEDDTLHLVFRHWRNSDVFFNPAPSTYYAALSYQRKPKGGQWSSPEPLVLPERGNYSIYYHKLAIDHQSRLFLSLSYFDWVLYENRTDPNEAYWRRMVLVSHDRGGTWSLAETADFPEPVQSEPDNGIDEDPDLPDAGNDESTGPDDNDDTDTSNGRADNVSSGCGCLGRVNSMLLVLLLGLTMIRIRPA